MKKQNVAFIAELKTFREGIVPGSPYSQAVFWRLIFAALIALLESK